MRAALLVLASACSFGTEVPSIDAPPLTPPTTMFIFEAEAFVAKTTTTHDWTEVTTEAGYSGTGYMILSPDNSTPCATMSAVTTCGASLVYNLPIDDARTYYIYTRLFASNGSHDSLWFGIDGAVEDVIDVMEDSTWRWTGGKPLALAAGLHTLHVWQREGARFDMIAVMPTAAPP
jgi:hypothetical protein